MADRPVEPPQTDENQIAEEAARWFEALKTAGPEQQAEYAAWLRRSPRRKHGVRSGSGPRSTAEERELRDSAEMFVRPGPELAFVRFDDSPSFLARLRDKVRFGLPLKDLDRPNVVRPADDAQEGPAVIEARR